MVCHAVSGLRWLLHRLHWRHRWWRWTHHAPAMSTVGHLLARDMVHEIHFLDLLLLLLPGGLIHVICRPSAHAAYFRVIIPRRADVTIQRLMVCHGTLCRWHSLLHTAVNNTITTCAGERVQDFKHGICETVCIFFAAEI